MQYLGNALLRRALIGLDIIDGPSEFDSETSVQSEQEDVTDLEPDDDGTELELDECWTGLVNDFNESVTTLKQAIQSIRPSHHRWFLYLHDLGLAVTKRSMYLKTVEFEDESIPMRDDFLTLRADFNRGISLLNEAVKSAHPHHAEYEFCVGTLRYAEDRRPSWYSESEPVVPTTSYSIDSHEFIASILSELSDRT